MTTRATRSHLSHWGAFDAIVEGDHLVGIQPFERDPNPSPMLANIPSSVRHRTRIAGPMVRSGWLEAGPGPTGQRGSDPFVSVSWDRLTDLLSGELTRVYKDYGASSVYGGSYGWASAGRFHHAQSQVHRFLNLLGGYTASVDSYSHGAGDVILRHAIGSADMLRFASTSWRSIVDHAELFITFGGIPMKNTMVSNGGVFRHRARSFLDEAAANNIEFISFSPLRDDMPDNVSATWHQVSPGSDVAVMLGLAHVLITENLHDRAFLDRYCAGFDRLERYVLGVDDGQPKSPEWAAALSDVPAEDLRSLARKMVGQRTFITTTWSLQRNEYGEQPPWMALALAAMLGQIGLPGGGYGFGYGSVQRMGEGRVGEGIGLPGLSQGANRAGTFIPVARVSDMLLNPGEAFDYDGGVYAYPDVKLVYWCGGNPFHHHQDLGKLRRAFGQADTIVCHDPFWTSMARHSDIVIPSTVTLERNDIGGSQNDAYLAAMQQAIPPYARSRNDYDTFSDLASALGTDRQFTEGRDEDAWLRHMYEDWRRRAARYGHHFPEFDQFWAEGYLQLPFDEAQVLFSDFRSDPDENPLDTPSGKIEIFSEDIGSFGYDDCSGHPAWFSPQEWLGSERAEQFPLLMIANNPRSRLHSQLDVGEYSQDTKIDGREPLRIHPDDAAARGLSSGDIARVYNDRGSFLAGVIVAGDVRSRVVQVSTGAWYDPLDPGDPASMCVHGNPNTVTLDRGTSKLAQGSVGQHALVEVERWTEPVPPVTVLDPPAIIEDLRGQTPGHGAGS